MGNLCYGDRLLELVLFSLEKRSWGSGETLELLPGPKRAIGELEREF